MKKHDIPNFIRITNNRIRVSDICSYKGYSKGEDDEKAYHLDILLHNQKPLNIILQNEEVKIAKKQLTFFLQQLDEITNLTNFNEKAYADNRWW